MTSYDFLNAAQTAMLAVLAIAIIYGMYLLRNELRQAGAIVRQVAATQGQMQENLRRMWERIDAIEARQGIQGEADTFIRMNRLLEAFETGRPPDPPRP